MGIPIGELQQRVSSREFVEYWAFDQLEPFGPERADINAGIVASTVANSVRNPKKRQRPYSPAEFIPKYGPPEVEEELTPEEFEARIEAAFVAAGGDPGAPPSAEKL